MGTPGYVAQTLLTGKTFTVWFLNLHKRGFRSWVAMQFVGFAVTLAGDLVVRPANEGKDLI